MILPTVTIHHPLDPNVRMLINESDLTDEHELWDDASTGDGLRVVKGARGLWFVRRGAEKLSVGFKAEADALTEMARLAAV